jgi:sulfate permease, SulP family
LHEPVMQLMKSTGFYQQLGADHFLSEDQAIGHLFHKVIDPAICIYECEVRAFLECQNLPKQIVRAEIPPHTHIPAGQVDGLTPLELWEALHQSNPPVVIDVREPREFRQGHIPQAQLIPLPRLLAESPELHPDRRVVFVCRGGRRSTRAAYIFSQRGYAQAMVLLGGMLAWENAGLLEAVD